MMLFLACCTVSAQRLPGSLNSEKEFKVILFVGLECPISQKYMKKIEELKNKYKYRVDFIAVVPERVSLQQIDAYKKEYNSSLKFVLDNNLKIVELLNAKITPEVFLLDKWDRLKYRGAIDNWFYALGKYRRETTAHYLVDAMDAVLQNNEPRTKVTDAVGCFIETKSLHHAHH